MTPATLSVAHAHLLQWATKRVAVSHQMPEITVLLWCQPKGWAASHRMPEITSAFVVQQKGWTVST
jgi:hypothetical protein